MFGGVGNGLGIDPQTFSTSSKVRNLVIFPLLESKPISPGLVQVLEVGSQVNAVL